MDITCAKQLKHNIRKEIIAKRNLLSADYIKCSGERLCEIICKSDIYLSSDKVLAYASYGTEISTYPFIEVALNAGKKVYLPKVIEKDISFYRIFDVKELLPGFKGIPEPEGNTELYVYRNDESLIGSLFEDKSMILMPGVAFDTDGNRLGYGGGFYDRFLADKPNLLKNSIAFGFDFQKVNTLPTEAFDIKPARIFYIV